MGVRGWGRAGRKLADKALVPRMAVTLDELGFLGLFGKKYHRISVKEQRAKEH